MSRKTPRILAAVIVGLVLVLLVLQSNDQQDGGVSGRPLLPEFKELANDATEVRISARGDDESVTLRRESGQWIVGERDDYAADIDKLRQLIIALTDGMIIEEKTSNPEQYAKLGVDDPASGGSGKAVNISGPAFSYSIIVGNQAQGEFRYVRIADQATSFLIDRNLDVPGSASDWLLADIIDVGAERIRRVSITHADGEELVIEKSAQELTDFAVPDIPAGRELSYATVGNGIAAALGQLTLDDVRKAVDFDATTVAEFVTWDGLMIKASVATDDDDTNWVAFAAVAAQPADDAGDGPGEEAVNEAHNAADELNARLSGWQYRIPAYKENQLTRRWEDILKANDGDQG